MKNVTLSMDEEILKAGREYARQHNTSLNELIRNMLAERVAPRSENWLAECFRLMDRAKVRVGGKRWKREDLYDG